MHTYNVRIGTTTHKNIQARSRYDAKVKAARKHVAKYPASYYHTTDVLGKLKINVYLVK